jgi:hypothetical protein
MLAPTEIFVLTTTLGLPQLAPRRDVAFLKNCHQGPHLETFSKLRNSNYRKVACADLFAAVPNYIDAQT